MEKYKIYTDSWHYKFSSWLMNHPPRAQDFCSYWGNLIGNMLAVCFVIGCAMILLTAFAIAAYLHPINVLIGIGSILAFFSVVFYMIHRSYSPSGLIATKYNAWKNNYCPMIEFETKEK